VTRSTFLNQPSGC